MTTNDPISVIVPASISFHQALNAVEEFAEKYPIDRLAVIQAERLEMIAGKIRERLTEAYIGESNRISEEPTKAKKEVWSNTEGTVTWGYNKH